LGFFIIKESLKLAYELVTSKKSGPQIFYVKEALGKDGRPINVYKVRTMYVGAEYDFSTVVGNGFDGLGKPKEDPRTSSTGKWLRRHFFDEIPQIFNMVRGDMSIVGIRPHSFQDWLIYPEDVREQVKNAALRHKPGFFGVNYSRAGITDARELSSVILCYLNEKEASPFWTDVKYLGRIIFNIATQKVHSH